MEIAKIADGQVEKYPVGTAEVEAAVIAAQEPGNEYYFRLADGPNVPDLSEFGYTVIEPVDPPEAGDGEVAVRDGIEQYEPGKWRMVWIVRPMTAEEKKALVPVSITRRQARTVLSRHGYLATVDAAIAAMPGQAGEEARIDWADALEFRRDYPLIETLRLLLVLTDEKVDDMYIEGSAI